MEKGVGEREEDTGDDVPGGESQTALTFAIRARCRGARDRSEEAEARTGSGSCMKTHEQDSRRCTPSDASVLGRSGGGDKPVADDDVGTGCGGVVAR